MTALSAPALAQQTVAAATEDDGSAASTASDDIIVQARRRDESQQDVPLVVNAVTAENIAKLNIREFQDIQTVVPGLQLSTSANGIGTQASLRGVAFDVNASGNNGTIEFYLNDAPLSAGILFQSMFDVGQIEVLRGPQGTLRGRASPSGSITVTTQRPDLNEVGGYVTMTGTTRNAINVNGAVGLPIIRDVLAIRLAGVYEENDGNRVHSINNGVNPFVKTKGGRISLRFEPTDYLSFNGSYTKTIRDARQFFQVESLSETIAGAPASPTRITAGQRLAVGYAPQAYRQDFQVWNWQAQLRFAGQKLDYVGSHNDQHYTSNEPNDKGAFFGPAYGNAIQTSGLITSSRGKQTTHELRLSNEERIAGIFDYVIGGLHNKLESPTVLSQQQVLFNGLFIGSPFVPFPFDAFITPGGITAPPMLGVSGSVIPVPIIRESQTVEKSAFGNITAHIGGNTEISGGIRYIDYRATASLVINGQEVLGARENRNPHHTIYSASIKHQITPDLMAYASYGSSWRPGSSTNAIVFRDLFNPSPRLQSFYYPGDETSNSFEIGFKSEWLSRRLRVNVTAYQQDYQNYAYTSSNLYVLGENSTGAPAVFLASPGIAVGVPARVRGVEAEIAFKATERWNISASFSYAKSNIRNGVVPCSPVAGAVPNVADFANVAGGIATCNVNYSASINPNFGATIQSEYVMPISPRVDGYLRGLLSFAGNSQNDPANPVDDVQSFALVNLYAGLRDPEGGWEVGLFAKNLFNVERVLSRNAAPYGVGYTQLYCLNDPQLPPQAQALAQALCPSNTAVNPLTNSFTASSTYRGITMTPPREFGLTVRYAFGSR